MASKRGCICLTLILLAIVATCQLGCGTGRTSAASAPAVQAPGLGQGVTTAEVGAAMAAAARVGGDPRRIRVLHLALKELGKKGKLGGMGPDVWDCSGLVQHCYAKVGLRLPRVTFDQVKVGTEVTRKDLLPGDLLLFWRDSHVGMYIGSGLMIHAFGKVKVDKFSKYAHSVSAIRRVIPGP